LPKIRNPETGCFNDENYNCFVVILFGSYAFAGTIDWGVHRGVAATAKVNYKAVQLVMYCLRCSKLESPFCLGDHDPGVKYVRNPVKVFYTVAWSTCASDCTHQSGDFLIPNLILQTTVAGTSCKESPQASHFVLNPLIDKGLRDLL
jgi:hypothetical protein